MAKLTLSLLAVCSALLTPGTTAANTDNGQWILANEISRVSNQSLVWGPYRPNLYFGVKPRIPKSMIAGLMWSKVDDFASFAQTVRHTCEQSDDMAGYGWDEYDVRTGGRQVIKDPGNSIDIHTEFIKIEGGENGGHWGVRVKGIPRPGAPVDLKTMVIFYVGLEGLGSLSLQNEPDERGLAGDVTLEGSMPELGEFKIDITTGPGTNKPPQVGHKKYWKEKPLDRTLYRSLKVPEEDVWKAKDTFFVGLRDNFLKAKEKYGESDLPPPWQAFTIPNTFGPGNFHMVQKVFEGGFEFDILYSSASAPTSMTTDILTEKIRTVGKSFADRFENIFPREPPFNAPRYRQFARNFFSNLLGGIGHFYGTSVIDRTYAPEYEEEDEGFWEEAKAAQARPDAAKLEGPTELFTSIPSRPFFPRGFLWDEGFHLLPISDWDMDLTLQIVKSWVSLVDGDGWLPREQILGDEARSKVPQEFQTQYPHYANPPTLFFVLTKFIDQFEEFQSKRGDSANEYLDKESFDNLFSSGDLPTVHLENPKAASEYLRSIYPNLRRNYFWYRKSQSGEIRGWDRNAYSKKEGYRWRGRTPEHCLTSGLDDYPRARPPHTGELHVDLLSWIGMMTSCIRRIAAAIGEHDDVAEFEQYEYSIKKNLDDLHWNEKHQTYCDATIDDFEESVHVCHKGYISIFPFLLGLMEKDSEKLGKVLDLIADPEELWSNYGLRSLSKKDEYYGTGENYWRGPIWININYLAIQRLMEYGSEEGPHQKQAAGLYKELRVKVVENVYKSWKDTGYAWEQYDAETGKGQRTAHFLGWTSLVVKIMNMPEAVSVVATPPKDEL
ncbi:glycoside hydrolase [Tuber indicum]|nr:glycoside hydrolase [Tuber indicum]